MKPRKPNNLNTFKIHIKLLPLIILCLLLGCKEAKEAKQVLPTENQIIISESAININTAATIELEKLPHIGTISAQRIVEHREKFGKFRKVEYLMLVDGISDKRFREIKNMIRVE